LLDIALLRSRHDAEMDWPALSARFAAAGHGAVLVDTLSWAETLFGQPMPAGMRRNDEAIARMERAVEVGGRTGLGTSLTWLLRDVAVAFRADPRRLLTAIRRRMPAPGGGG